MIDLGSCRGSMNRNIGPKVPRSQREIMQRDFMGIHSLTWHICVTAYSILPNFSFFLESDFHQHFVSTTVCRYRPIFPSICTFHPVLVPECWSIPIGFLVLKFQAELCADGELQVLGVEWGGEVRVFISLVPSLQGHLGLVASSSNDERPQYLPQGLLHRILSPGSSYIPVSSPSSFCVISLMPAQPLYRAPLLNSPQILPFQCASCFLLGPWLI